MSSLDHLLALAERALARDLTPYSDRPRGAVALLSDGSWTRTARIESASYGLTIPAAVGAVSVAIAAGRRDIVAVALSDALTAADRAYLADLPTGPLTPLGPRAAATGSTLPHPTSQLDHTFPAPEDLTPERGIAFARRAAHHALPIHSGFPVGCVLLTESGKLIPGANVEHMDWTRTLCAERCALAAALSLGHRRIAAVYLSCPGSPGATPCGACRQLLAEWAADAELWIDHGAAPPRRHSVASLIPSPFGLPASHHLS